MKNIPGNFWFNLRELWKPDIWAIFKYIYRVKRVYRELWLGTFRFFLNCSVSFKNEGLQLDRFVLVSSFSNCSIQFPFLVFLVENGTIPVLFVCSNIYCTWYFLPFTQENIVVYEGGCLGFGFLRGNICKIYF